MYKDRRFCHCWSRSLQMNVMAKWIIAREKSFLFRTIANLCLPILSIWTTDDENWQLQCNFEKEDLLWLQIKLRLQDNFKQGSLLWLQCNSNEQLHWWQHKAQKRKWTVITTQHQRSTIANLWNMLKQPKVLCFCCTLTNIFSFIQNRILQKRVYCWDKGKLQLLPLTLCSQPTIIRRH